MRRDRPQAISAMAIINIIFGALSILCGSCGAFAQLMLTSMAKTPGPGGGPNPVAQLMTALNRDCPGYQLVEGGRAVLVIVLGVVLVAAAVGLLMMQSWARWVTLAYVVLAIPLHLGYLGYEIGVVLPVTERFQAGMQLGPGTVKTPQQQGRQAGAVMGVVGAAGISVIHAVANGIVMLLPAVGAAFAPRRRRRRDHDDDENEDDEYDNQYRRRRRPRDEWDE
jgi:hypothetical protein